MHVGTVPYRGAGVLQRSLAGGVSQGAVPDTILLLEHPPVVTLGRRTDEGAELHVPESADVEVVETNRGGKSTFHGPGQPVCYPILDLKRHGRDVQQYVRNLAEVLIKTLARFELTGERIDGLAGVWLTRPPRESAASAGPRPPGAVPCAPCPPRVGLLFSVAASTGAARAGSGVMAPPGGWRKAPHE